MTDLDYSFIRLRDNLQDAHNLGESPNVTNFYLGQVQLLPNDPLSYLQITNSPVSIEFDTYEVYVVDCAGNETDITGNVFIVPFTDANGIEQITFEIVGIANDFGPSAVYLRFDFTLAAVLTSFYSNKILITRDRENYTTRFDYANDSTYEGIDYDNAPFIQSIRLNTYFKQPISASEITPYTQISRNITISQRPTILRYNRYIATIFDAWTSQRLEILVNSNTVYITRFNDNIGIRNYSVEAIDFGERKERSNAFEFEYILQADQTDTFTPQYQIYEGLTFTLDPLSGSIFSFGMVIDEVFVTYNTNVVKNASISGLVTNLTTMATLPINDASTFVGGAILTIDTSGFIDPIGQYLIELDAGAVSDVNIPATASPAITDWRIYISNGGFDSGFDLTAFN